jgi:uncharacterized membrane protein YraQ (UPF0718 family)
VEVNVFTYFLYGVVIVFLTISFVKDKNKTKKALIKAWKSFENILPQFLTVLIIIAVFLTIFDSKTISKILGEESGVIGLIISAVIGSITLIPGFIAFPLAASLLKAGAGYPQITMLLTTLMMVGIVTVPIEIQYFGKQTTIRRNVFALIFSIIISIIVGVIIS